jgi:hypothetical protein
MPKPVIRRYFADPCVLKNVGQDFKRLITAINNSRDEYTLQLRENSFNVYFKGSSLASVSPSTGGRYAVRIHRKFLEGAVLKHLSQHCVGEPYGGTNDDAAVFRFFVEPKSLPRFFQSKHLTAIASNIAKVNYSEELTFEQMLMTDNPPTNKMVIIDRQIADHDWKRQLDLLAVAREGDSGPFHFLVIEVKTGKNPELKRDVGEQLEKYVGHIEKHMSDYVDCYTENYRQKKCLGLLPDNLPETIEISGAVKGVVVTGGYSRIAKDAIRELRGHYDVHVQSMDNLITPI